MSDWRAWARCRDVGPDVFYPEHAEEGQYELARMICGECCVRAQCLQWALANAETRWGMWGGLTPMERRQAKREAGLPRRRLKPHGTRAAYLRHLDDNEQPCEDCTTANRAYHHSRHIKKSKDWAS